MHSIWTQYCKKRRILFWLFFICIVFFVWCLRGIDYVGDIFCRGGLQFRMSEYRLFDQWFGHVTSTSVIRLFHIKVVRLFGYRFLHFAQKKWARIVFACLSSCHDIGQCIHLCTICYRYVLFDITFDIFLYTLLHTQTHTHTFQSSIIAKRTPCLNGCCISVDLFSTIVSFEITHVQKLAEEMYVCSDFVYVETVRACIMWDCSRNDANRITFMTIALTINLWIHRRKRPILGIKRSANNSIIGRSFCL